MPSSSGVASRQALLFLRLPDLGCHVSRQIRRNASYSTYLHVLYWLRMIRAACKLLLQTYTLQYEYVQHIVCCC